jgi:hypothetical protein
MIERENMIEILKKAVSDPELRLKQLALYLGTNFFTEPTLEVILSKEEFEKLKQEGVLIEVHGYLLNKRWLDEQK